MDITTINYASPGASFTERTNNYILAFYNVAHKYSNKEQHEGECGEKYDQQDEVFKKILKEGMDNYETTLKDLKDR